MFPFNQKTCTSGITEEHALSQLDPHECRLDADQASDSTSDYRSDNHCDSERKDIEDSVPDELATRSSRQFQDHTLRLAFTFVKKIIVDINREIGRRIG